MESICRLYPGKEGGRHVRGDPVMKPCLCSGRALLRTVWWLFPESVPSLPLDTCLAPGVREAIRIAAGVSHCTLCLRAPFTKWPRKQEPSGGSRVHTQALVPPQGSIWGETASSGGGSGAAHGHMEETPQGSWKCPREKKEGLRGQDSE